MCGILVDPVVVDALVAGLSSADLSGASAVPQPTRTNVHSALAGVELGNSFLSTFASLAELIESQAETLRLFAVAVADLDVEMVGEIPG